MRKVYKGFVRISSRFGAYGVGLAMFWWHFAQAKTRENSDFATKITEINVELSGNSQRYVNECCESESDGKIEGFGARC
jgi:hypothetical protein